MADYTQNCVGSSPPYCGSAQCTTRERPPSCIQLTTCSGTCTCLAPKANSHQVSDGCLCSHQCGTMPYEACLESKLCVCSGVCGYDCDVGYTYNPVSGDCELIPVIIGTGIGQSPIVFALVSLVGYERKRKRRKKQFYYLLFL